MFTRVLKREKLQEYGFPKPSGWRGITILIAVGLMLVGAAMLAHPIRIFLVGSDSGLVTFLIFIVLLLGQFSVSFLIASRQINAMGIDTEKKIEGQIAGGGWCISCFKTLPDGATVCTNCGTKLRGLVTISTCFLCRFT